MPHEQRYILKVLFDKTQTSASKIDEQLSRLLSCDLRTRANVNVTCDVSGHPTLLVTGSLEDVDRIHGIIEKHLIRRQQLGFVRLVDDAGAEIRARAYHVVARIEQRLRSFVDHAGISLLGFTGWRRFVYLALLDDIQRVATSDAESDMTLTPLECTQIEDLLTLVTWKAREWSPERSLSVDDVLEVAETASSFEDFVKTLKSKATESSAWDDVFHRFFEDTGEWTQVRSDLEFVVSQRHRIMHHRPMRLGTLEPLEDKERHINAFFGRVAPKLSDSDLDQARSAMSRVGTVTMATRLSQFASLAPFHQTLQAQEFYQRLAEATRPTKEMQQIYQRLADATRPTRQMQEFYQRLAEATRPAKEMQNVMDNIARIGMETQQITQRLFDAIRPRLEIEALASGLAQGIPHDEPPESTTAKHEPVPGQDEADDGAPEDTAPPCEAKDS